MEAANVGITKPTAAAGFLISYPHNEIKHFLISFVLDFTGGKVISPGGVSSHVKQPVTDRDDVIHYEKCLMRSPPPDTTL